MPCIDELIDQLRRAKYISTIDLTRGYWQVPVAEEDRPKTAFVTPSGLYQFRVLPFGLSGAPESFQHLMDQLTANCQGFASAHLDDLVIFSDTWADHLQHLETVLLQLQRAGLTVKPSKCQLAMEQCLYLGHVVGNGTVKLELSKIAAVESFLTPKTKKEVRALLGLTGYY